MKSKVEELVRQFSEARKRRLRFEALIAALSVLVTGSVSWQLRRVGTAFSPESNPAAEMPAAGLPVVETDADPPDQTARSGIAEEPEDWEAVLPVFTDETPQQRIAAIAQSQLGYAEASGAVLLSDDGASRTGYTRYGAWYGNPYGEWNTMFTYFCMYYAGIEREEIPYGSGCWAWYETLIDRDMIAPCGNEKAGDIIFFDTDADGTPDRTGIISGTEETQEGMMLRIIEGNCEGTVAEKQYLRGGSDMIGVLSADLYVTETVSSIVLIDYSAETDAGILVNAQAAEGVFPEGTVMKAADVSDEEAMQAAADTYGESAEIHDAVAVDITFINADGEEIEPADGASVYVQISLPTEKTLSGDIYSLVHVDDEGEASLVENARVASDSAVFEAESFSVYVITTFYSHDPAGSPNDVDAKANWWEASMAKRYFYEDVNYDSNDESHPYIVYVGDLIEIVSDQPLDVWDNYIDGTGWVLEPVDGYNLEGYIHGLKNEQRYIDIKDANGNVTETRLMYCNTFRAVNPGQTIRITDDGGASTRYFTVHEPIMVDSNHGFKQRDQIREWLGAYDGFTAGINFGDFGLTDKDGYIPNSKDRPYLLFPNELITFYTDSTRSDQEFRLYYYSSSSTQDWERIDITDYSTRTRSEVDGKQRYQVYFAPGLTGYVLAEFSENHEQFWMRVWENTEFNHADMEIADNGTYTISTAKTENGVTTIEVEVYKADVTFVHDAYLYDEHKNVVQHYTSKFDPAHPAYKCKTRINEQGEEVPIFDLRGHRIPDVVVETDQYGNIVFDENGRAKPLDANGQWIPIDNDAYTRAGNPYPFVPVSEDVLIGDYEHFGKPGSTQYEYTSAWLHNSIKKDLGPSGQPEDTIASKPYNVQDVKSATFLVDLELTPKKKYVYTVTNGVPVLDDDKTILDWDGTGGTATADSGKKITFTMNEQDVIDAENKCPLNNGLDFTAKAEFTVLNLPIKKIMKNGEMTDGQFTYNVIDLNGPDPSNPASADYRLYSTVSNNWYPLVQAEDGKVSLPDVSAAATQSTLHKFAAYELFDANGNWGSHINGAVDTNDLLNKLQTKVFDESAQPFKHCQNAQDVFNLVVNGIRPRNWQSQNDPYYDPDKPVAESEKAAFYQFMANYLQNSHVAGNETPDGDHFNVTSDSYVMLLDYCDIAASASVGSITNDAETNTAYGTAYVNNMRFGLPKEAVDGRFTYKFAVHESVPIDVNGVTYDDRIQYFNVEVRTTDDGFLVAYPVFLKQNPDDPDGPMIEDTDLKDLTFTNVRIMLPETGGTGTLPYLAGGIFLISAAFILPLIRRRKEGECDS